MLDKLLYLYKIHKPKSLGAILSKQTKKEKYGDENYNNREGRAATNKEKYGCENPFQCKEIMEPARERNVLKYGSKNNIAKNLETRIKNSGSLEASYANQQKTYQATCQEKYGVDNPAKASETIDKIKDTWQNKSEEEMKEIKDKSWKKYTYKGLSFDSSWELYYYIWAELHEHDIIREPKVLKYEFNGVSHSYIPDFEVDGELIEIKSDYLFEQMQVESSMDNAKYKCMLENHVKIIKLEEMQPIIEEVTKLFGNNYLEQFLEVSK